MGNKPSPQEKLMLKFVNHFGNYPIVTYSNIRLTRVNYDYHIIIIGKRIFEYDSTLDCHACYNVTINPSSDKSTTYDFTIPSMYSYIFRAVYTGMRRDTDFKDYLKQQTVTDYDVHELFIDYWSEMVNLGSFDARLNNALSESGLM